MGKIIIFIFLFLIQFSAQAMTGDEILQKLDRNYTFSSASFKALLIITNGPEIKSKRLKIDLKDDYLALAEFLTPQSEAGVKYLKMNNTLDVYFPAAEKIISLSGALLDQSLAGSDFSYRDLLGYRSLAQSYTATVVSEETQTYKLELIARNKREVYQKRILLVDKEKFVVLEGEFYSANGKPLKKFVVDEIGKSGRRYFPTKLSLKDLTRINTKTQLVITDLAFNIYVPPYLFTRSYLEMK